MTVKAVTCEGKIFLVHSAEDGTCSTVIEIEDDIDEFENLNKLVEAYSKEIFEKCVQHGIDPAEISAIKSNSAPS